MTTSWGKQFTAILLELLGEAGTSLDIRLERDEPQTPVFSIRIDRPQDATTRNSMSPARFEGFIEGLLGENSDALPSPSDPQRQIKALQARVEELEGQLRGHLPTPAEKELANYYISVAWQNTDEATRTLERALPKLPQKEIERIHGEMRRARANGVYRR
jgi:hypothetical protein